MAVTAMMRSSLQSLFDKQIITAYSSNRPRVVYFQKILAFEVEDKHKTVQVEKNEEELKQCERYHYGIQGIVRGRSVYVEIG